MLYASCLTLKGISNPFLVVCLMQPLISCRVGRKASFWEESLQYLWRWKTKWIEGKCARQRFSQWRRTTDWMSSTEWGKDLSFSRPISSSSMSLLICVHRDISSTRNERRGREDKVKMEDRKRGESECYGEPSEPVREEKERRDSPKWDTRLFRFLSQVSSKSMIGLTHTLYLSYPFRV